MDLFWYWDCIFVAWPETFMNWYSVFVGAALKLWTGTVLRLWSGKFMDLPWTKAVWTGFVNFLN